MGMIDGKPLADEPLPPGYRRRVVVKFRDELQLDYADVDTDDARDRLRERLPRWRELDDAFGVLDPVRLFVSLTPDEISDRMVDARSRNGRYTRNLLTYFAVDCPDGVEPEALAAKLRSWDDVVETAYVETRPLPPPALIPPDPGQNPRRGFQPFLKIADTHAGDFAGAGADAFHPNGIGAAFAWCFAGGDGAGVRLVDVEQGWDFDHEDLVAANFAWGPTGAGKPAAGLNQAQHGHGTAVLGEVIAVPNNCLGGVGIAPGATCLTVSEWTDTTAGAAPAAATTFNTADAVLAAIDLIGPGDVILLESQAEVDLDGDGTPDARLPREVEPAVFDAILNATLSDRIVVEPAANEGISLDERDFLPDFAAPGWRFPLRESFPDSGAIMVAACAMGKRCPTGETNFGARVDCFALGAFVDSTWCHTPVAPGTYTDSQFSGTSAAAPIVAGAVLAIQGIWKAAHDGTPLGAAAMRDILRDPGLSIPSDPPDALIGLMPDLVAVITRKLGLAPGDCPADGDDCATCFDYALDRERTC